MILFLVLSQIVVSVFAGDRLRALGTVEVEAGLLRWTQTQDHVSFSIEAKPFLQDSWLNVSECAGSTGSCDVSAVIRDAEHGCVRLRVRTWRGPGQSETEEACSVSEERCTPQMNVSASSNSILVRLTRHHPLQEDYAHSASHRVCYWSLDEPKPLCKKTLSSLSLPLTDQDHGRTYCVTVQYLLYGTKPVGLRRCPVCVEVPQVRFKHTGLVLGIVLPLFALALAGGLAYIIIFHKKKVKTWLKPEPDPDCLTLPLHCSAVCPSPEEHCSIITGVTEIGQD